jgi:hypothetical protein
VIEIEWDDGHGSHTVRADFVKLWQTRGGGREHPDGTVVEAYRDGSGILQMDADDYSVVYIKEVP